MSTITVIADIADAESLTYDDVFGALADERRRYALYCLKSNERSLPLADLAREIARTERDTEDQRLAQVSNEYIHQVYLDLYHVHVPKLVDAGLVEYDDEEGIVRLVPVLDAVDLTDIIE